MKEGGRKGRKEEGRRKGGKEGGREGRKERGREGRKEEGREVGWNELAITTQRLSKQGREVGRRGRGL